jgi:predicted hydrolase (HD superfamily)
MKVDIPFSSFLEAISSLETAEKHQLWQLLEAELFADEEDSPEDIAEIQAAHNDYAAGDYITFDEYHLQRANKLR